MPLRLLPRSALVTTGPVDHADWNYRPLLGWISRQRVRLVAGLLAERPRCGSLLEIGYGSGVFLPTWTQFTCELHGIDIHGQAGEVAKVLAAHGIGAELRTGTAEALPYPDASFDAVVAVSVLEFIPDLAAACREVARVLRPDGRFLVATPHRSRLADIGLRVLTGRSAAADFGGRRERILQTLGEHFRVGAMRAFPRSSGKSLRLYTALSLAKMPLLDHRRV
jgi:ubiquinone/menaquinone biosynthesis C-methylase UbiE